MNNNSRRKVLDIIVAILAGIAIWLYVVSVQDPVSDTTIKAVPVQLTNIEAMQSSGLAIAGTGEYTVDVLISCNRSTLKNVSADDFIATADVSKLTVGQNYINVEVLAPGTVKIKEIRTQSIQVYVDTAVSVEKPIWIIPEGLADATELGALVMDADAVTVSGAKSLVDKIAGVKAVINCSEMQLDEKTSNSLELVPTDNDGNRVYGVKLSQDTLTVDSVLYAVKEVAINVNITGEFGEHISVRSEIVPASAVLKGPSNILAELWQIDAQAIDKSAVTESCSIPITLILPDGVEVADASKSLSVDYELKGRVENSVSIKPENIVFLNLDPWHNATANVEEQFVFSLYDDAAEFNEESVFITVNLAGLSEGTHELEYEIGYTAEFEDVIVVSAPETIEISLEKLQ